MVLFMTFRFCFPYFFLSHNDTMSKRVQAEALM